MTHSNSHLSLANLDEWLFYLESIHATEIDMGLARIASVAKCLQIDLSHTTVVTVAGTNGKGTTCAFLENALLAQGHSVAVYSSPHIEYFNERLRINKHLIDDQRLIKAFERIEISRADVSLTYYEFTTLAAMMIVQQCSPEYFILEVGLGGRLDATNLIDSDISVITSIDLDHQHFLGNTRDAIGYEKAGILRGNKPGVIGDLQVPNSVLDYAKKIGCNSIVRNQDFHIVGANITRPWQYQSKLFTLNDLPAPFIPRDNVATGLMVLEQLGFSLTETNVRQWITSTKLEGRTEILSKQPLVILDVGHNPHAARYLNGFVKANKRGNVFAVVAMLKDKDIQATLHEMTDCVDVWHVASLANPRGANKQILEQILKDENIACNSFDNVVDAYKIAKEKANNNDMILVFGSFFTVASIKKSAL